MSYEKEEINALTVSKDKIEFSQEGGICSFELKPDEDFRLMKTKFVDNGIPVVSGEFGAMRCSALTGNTFTSQMICQFIPLRIAG